MPSDHDVRLLAEAQDLLKEARESCSRARQTMFDQPERVLQNSAMCRNFLHDTMLLTLSPFVNIHYDNFRERTQPALAAPSDMRPKPLVPVQSFSKILGWANLSVKEDSVVKLICHPVCIA